MTEKKKGRPASDRAKGQPVSVRLNDDDYKRLLNYASRESKKTGYDIPVAGIIRRAILELLDRENA